MILDMFYWEGERLINMKRICLFIILLNLITYFDVSASDSTKYDEYNNVIVSIAPYISNIDNQKITRGNCIATIMKLIGVNKEAADKFANANYNNPVFYDIGDDDLNAGYIILAKFSDVAVGVNIDRRNIGYFEPKRNVTVKECLTFMLRCLKDSDSVVWENVMTDSIKIGLLQEDELDIFVADAPLLNKDFCTLLSRMLNMNRYLYWPTEELQTEYANSMQIDISKSITYIDCILEDSGN